MNRNHIICVGRPAFWAVTYKLFATSLEAVPDAPVFQIATVACILTFASALYAQLPSGSQKQFKFKEGIALNLIGEAFNIFNQTNIRGTSNNNYPGRSISIGPFQPAQNGQPAQTVQSNFYTAVTTAGGFFGSGGPRAFQLAARLEF